MAFVLVCCFFDRVGPVSSLTDLLSSSVDDYFLTTKYFQQILAAVGNANLVVDPSGFIAPGTTIRIPFDLNETDIECTVILNVDLALGCPGVRNHVS